MIARRSPFSVAQLAMIAVAGIAIALLVSTLAGPLGYSARVAHGASLLGAFNGPADALHDPTAAPLDAWGDLMAAKAHGGWVLLVLGASVMLARLATRLPWGVGAWLSVGRRAMAVSVWITGGAVAFDGLSSGGSLATVAIAVVSALLALTHPTVPAPASGVTVTRAPQAGLTRPRVMLALAAAGIGGLLLVGCASWRARATTGAQTLLDCESAELRAAAADGIDLAVAAVMSTISGNGHPDAAAFRAALGKVKGDALRCAVAGAVAALAEPTPPPRPDLPQAAALVVDVGELRRAFAAVRDGWGVAGVRVAGQVL